MTLKNVLRLPIMALFRAETNQKYVWSKSVSAGNLTIADIGVWEAPQTISYHLKASKWKLSEFVRHW